MLVVQEHNIKLGGIRLSGQMRSIDISEDATIEDIEDDKGKTKASQPTGYESAKISIEFVLESSRDKTALEQIKEMQRLFRPYGQEHAKLLNIVNEDCAARGISKVYFKKLETKANISESFRIATLELVDPTTAVIRTKKKKSGSSSSNSKKAETKKNTKTKKDKSKSPSRRTRSTTKYKAKAKKLVKK